MTTSDKPLADQPTLADGPARKSGVSGETRFMIIALLIILLGGGAMFGLNKLGGAPPTPPPPVVPAMVTAAEVDALFAKARHRKGSITPTLTVVEFADFQCPSCRRAYKDSIVGWDKTLPAFRVGFVHLPLPMHERAVPAAIASEAAAKQGKFWEMYAQLFDKKNEDLTEKQLVAAASAAGLDAARFAVDRKNEKSLRKLVDGDLGVATDQKVDATPTFYIHDKAGNVAVLAGAGNLDRLMPDLKDGVIGNDPIVAPSSGSGGAPITLYINGKREMH